MENQKFFNSTINDIDIYKNNEGPYNNFPKIYFKKPSFISQNSINASEIETKAYINNNTKGEIYKLPKYYKDKIKQYQMHPFRKPNLKIVQEDIKNKISNERSSISKENQNYLKPKIIELTEIEKKINENEGNLTLINEEKKDGNEDENNLVIETRKKKKKKKKEKNDRINRKENLLHRYRKLNRVKNLYDSNDDDESEEEEEDEFVINPESYAIAIFDFFIIYFFLYYFITTTIYLCVDKCFCSSNKHITFSDLMLFLNDIICIIDLFLSFFRSYYNYNFKLVKSNKLIIKYYLKYDFFFDLLSAIPIFSINKYNCYKKEFQEKCYKYEMPKNFVVLKILSLLKSSKVKKILGRKKNQALDRFIELISDNYTIERIFIIFISTLKYIGIFHFFVCLHIFIGNHSYSNWLILTQAENKPFFYQYITSLYFILTTLTTVGYGDIICQSLLERIFQIIILAIGSVLYPYAVSSIGNLIKNDSNAKIKQQNNLTMLENIRRDYPNISFKLYNKIFQYLESKSSSLEKYDTNSLIESLPFSLKNHILFTMYKSQITNFKFFKRNNNSVFIAEVLNNFIPSIARKNEFLIYEGEILEEIIFIKDGRISFNAAINSENPMKSIKKYFVENFNAFTTEEEKRLIKENMDNKSHISHIGDLSYDRAKNKLNNAFKTIRNERIIGEKSQFQIQTYIEEKNNNNNENYSFDIKGGAIINDEGDYQYLKILDIRKNEHFGCVFMTLNKPCPLSLQVKSKLVELFLLKKEQALNLSKSYPNIWRKLYSKEYHNIRTIKKKTFEVLKKYIDINELFLNNFDELTLTNDIISNFDMNMIEKSIIAAEKSMIKKSHIRQNSIPNKEMIKNNTLNYEYDKKPKKLNLDSIKVNLKSKMKKTNFPIRRNSTYGEKKIQFSPKRNLSKSTSSKLNPRFAYLSSHGNKSYFNRSNKENSYNKAIEERRIRNEKMKKLKFFLIECKKFFINSKLVNKMSSFRSNKSNNIEKSNIYVPKFSFKKSCLKKKASPIDEIKYQINIIKDNTKNHLSCKNVEFDLGFKRDKNLYINKINNTNNKYKNNEDIIQDLKDICEDETNFSFCSTNVENIYNSHQLSIERRCNFEICSSYSNINHITKGRYIKDINFQKRLKLILKKYFLYNSNNKETNLNMNVNGSLSPKTPKTIAFSSGFESNIYFAEYEKLKSRLEYKKRQSKIYKKRSSNFPKKGLEKYNSYFGAYKFNRMNNRKKNFEKGVNETEIKRRKSLTTKKLSYKDNETNNNNVAFTTFKKQDKLLEKESTKTIGTNSLKVNKSKTPTISDKSSSNKKNSINSIDIDIKKDANLFNDNTEIEFVIDKEDKNKIINDNLFVDNDSNRNMNYKIYKNKKKNKKHSKNKIVSINDRNKEIINQVLGINIPNSNIIANNIITTSSNMKDTKEVEKIKNIETSFSIYNIIQKNINKNLNIIDNKENSSPRKYSRGFCCII